MKDEDLAKLIKERMNLSVTFNQTTEMGPVDRITMKVTLSVGEHVALEAEDSFDLPRESPSYEY